MLQPGSLGGALALPGAAVSEPEQFPRAELCALHRVHAGIGTFGHGERFGTLGGFNLSKLNASEKRGLEGRWADVKVNMGRWRMWGAGRTQNSGQGRRERQGRAGSFSLLSW